MTQINLLIFLLIPLVIVIDGKPNCTIYNPCGSNGYCRDDANDEWNCDCKFWWNGTLCDEQTNSGKQVIALGCIVAFLIALFCGLKIGYKILYIVRKKKQQQPTVTKKKEITYDTKLAHLALNNAKQSIRLSSVIIFVLTIILTVVALVAKWSLLQPIHDQIVIKYQRNQSIYYDKNSFCDVMNHSDFNVITFPVACFLILLFIIRTKRTSALRDKCYGYGGPPMPVDFISHIDRKFAAVVFAICADELLSIIQEALGERKQKAEGVIITYLLRLLQVVVMGFRYYPFLAAVYIGSIFTLTCATFYAWLDYSITIINQGMCVVDFYPSYEGFLTNTSSISLMLDHFGTGPNLLIIQLCTDIPRFLCLAYINVKLPMLVIKKVFYKFKKNISPEQRLLMKLTREQRIFFRIARPDSIEMLYVRNLFRSPDDRPPSQTLWARLIPKKIYEWRDDFRFSTRVVCVYSSIFLLLYFITIQACVRIIPRLKPWQDSMQIIVDQMSIIFLPDVTVTTDGTVDQNKVAFPVPYLMRPYLFAIFLTVTIIVIQLLVLLVNIRRNLFQVYRGDDCEIPRRQRSRFISYASGNFHFAGYFMGYLIWGFILIAVFSVIICVCIDAFIVFKSVKLLEIILKRIIPSLLFILFKQFLNKILAQYVFLQHHGEALSLNNRRILNILVYFNFFLDAFLGVLSSIIRLIKSIIAGILYMCRLDYSPMGRKLETFDGGFSAYCGFIHIECHHRHPIMLVCVSYLYTQVKMKQWALDEGNFNDLSQGELFELKVKPLSKYVCKWKLAVFLIQNPSIVYFRKSFLRQLKIEEVYALNDIDNNDKKNLQTRLSIYTRRMSAVRTSIAADNFLTDIEKQRF